MMYAICGIGLGMRRLRLRQGHGEGIDGRGGDYLVRFRRKVLFCFPLVLYFSWACSILPGLWVCFLCSSDFDQMLSFPIVVSFSFSPSSRSNIPPFSLTICRYQHTFYSDQMCLLPLFYLLACIPFFIPFEFLFTFF